jgi:hypothetical protein
MDSADQLKLISQLIIVGKEFGYKKSRDRKFIFPKINSKNLLQDSSSTIRGEVWIH